MGLHLPEAADGSDKSGDVDTRPACQANTVGPDKGNLVHHHRIIPFDRTWIHAVVVAAVEYLAI